MKSYGKNKFGLKAMRSYVSFSSPVSYCFVSRRNKYTYEHLFNKSISDESFNITSLGTLQFKIYA